MHSLVQDHINFYEIDYILFENDQITDQGVVPYYNLVEASEIDFKNRVRRYINKPGAVISLPDVKHITYLRFLELGGTIPDNFLNLDNAPPA